MKALFKSIGLALLEPVYRFYERHLCLWVNYYSLEVTALNSTPPVRVKVNKLQARIRYALGLFTVLVGALPVVGETIHFVRLPKGCRILGHLGLFSFSAGAAAQTLNVGDAASAARHLAATAVTAVGFAIPQAAQTGGVSFETTDDTLLAGDPTATNNCDLRSTVAGATLTAGAVYALHMAFAQD